jgi:threonine dehydrogenase-like Zn-dependent dehydrogenase
MKALYKTSPGAHTSALVDRPEPELAAPQDVKIKVSAVAVCGMDVHIYHGKFDCTPPFIMGHEMVGRVVETGSAVSEFKAGDRVVAAPHHYACGACEACLRGAPQSCPEKRTMGIQRDGAMAAYVVVREEYLRHVPANIPDKIAALIEPMTIVTTDILVNSALRPGETVAIIGAGQIGQLSLVAAKGGGASTVIMTGIDADVPVRFPAARKLGADYTINSLQEDAAAKIRQLTGGHGADLVVEVSGSQEGITTAIDAARIKGRICLLGMSRKPSVGVDWDKMLKKMLTLQFNMMADYRHMRKAMDIFASYPLDLSPLVTHEAPLEDWKRIFDELSAGKGIKAVLYPSEPV